MTKLLTELPENARLGIIWLTTVYRFGRKRRRTFPVQAQSVISFYGGNVQLADGVLRKIPQVVSTSTRTQLTHKFAQTGERVAPGSVSLPTNDYVVSDFSE